MIDSQLGEGVKRWDMKGGQGKSKIIVIGSTMVRNINKAGLAGLNHMV